MNAAAFYILAAVLVAGALAAVGLPGLREAAAGLLALVAGAGILAMASGAYLTGVLEIVLPAAAIAGLGLALRRARYTVLAGPALLSVRSLLPGAATALAFLAIVLIAFAGDSASWHTGSGGAALLTLLHYRAPFALVAAVVLAVVGVGGALLLGRTSEDERDYDRTHESRRLREERARRRREDRLAARRRRPASAEEGR